MPDQRHVSSMNVTFWPRSAPVANELAREMRCEQCGYDLRGLKELRCPECGTPFKPRQEGASQLPWKQRKAIGGFDGYWKTIGLILLSPQRLVDEVWYGGRIPERDTRLFRMITIGLAYVPLMIIVVALIGPHLSTDQFMIYMLTAAVFLLWWLDRSTRLLAKFFRKQVMRGDVQDRTIALAHLACAPLALSFIHVVLFAASAVAYRIDGPKGVMLPVIFLTWVVLGGLQLLAWLRASMVLVGASIRCTEGERIAIALMFLLYWTGHALIYLLVIPFSLHLLVTSVLDLF